MASGKIHGRVTKTLVLPSFGLVFLYTNDLVTGLLAGLGCVIGLIIEPDLDVDHTTMSERRMLKLPLVGLLWVALWQPYAKLMPHRHPLSHWPVLGTLIRVVYLFLIAFIPSLFIGIVIGYPEWFVDWVVAYRYSLMWFLVGLSISDYGHWMLDL